MPSRYEPCVARQCSYGVPKPNRTDKVRYPPPRLLHDVLPSLGPTLRTGLRSSNVLSAAINGTAALETQGQQRLSLYQQSDSCPQRPTLKNPPGVAWHVF